MSSNMTRNGILTWLETEGRALSSKATPSYWRFEDMHRHKAYIPQLEAARDAYRRIRQAPDNELHATAIATLDWLVKKAPDGGNHWNLLKLELMGELGKKQPGWQEVNGQLQFVEANKS